MTDTEPEVTVVIGASAPESSLGACLEALEPQRAGVQVVVVASAPSGAALRARFPWADFQENPGALVPELWRDGIARARGRIVALTIAPMLPADNWIATIIQSHQTYDAVGGAIDPGPNLRRVDWAEYFCRYARDMAPFEENDRDDLPGDNASYKRTHLLEEWEHLRDGFWEPVIHPALRRRGIRLWHTPVLLVHQGRSSGFRAFARQRSKHGRLYAHQRGTEFTRLRHAIGLLGSPAVPFLMTLRVFREVFARRRYRLQALLSTPQIFALNLVWAAAEARGHLEILAKR